MTTRSDEHRTVITYPDPTKNVLELVTSASNRLDELRQAEGRRLDELRASDARRLDDLRMAETRRLDERLILKTEYDERLLIAEAKRIDAIRAVDVAAVSVASQRASDQASVLANQVAQSAEALRALVATTAATVANSQQQLANTLSARLTTLEQAQYEGKGRTSYTDPTMMELAAQVRKLSDAATMSSGTRGGSAAVIAYVISGIIAVGGLISIAVALSHIPH